MDPRRKMGWAWLVVLGAVTAIALAGAAPGSATRPAATGPAATQPAGDLAGVLKKVIERNIESLQEKDLDKAMAPVHPKSPVYEGTRAALKQAFDSYDLRGDLLSFTFIGTDGEYAVARTKQQTSKVKGPAFRDNILDAIQVFKKDGSEWKLWQTTILEVQYPEAPRTQPGGTGK